MNLIHSISLLFNIFSSKRLSPCKSYIVILTLSFFTFGLGSLSSAGADDSGLINKHANAILSSFRLPDFITRKPVSYSPNSGKPTLLTFFSLSPTFREKRSLHLLDIQSKFSKLYSDRINSFALYSDDKKLDILRQYITDGLITQQVLDDNKRSVYGKYGVYMMPIAILINSNGQLHGVIPYTGQIEELLSTNIQYLLGDKDIDQLKASLEPKRNIVRSAEEKEYIRRINYGRVMLARKMYKAALREFTTATKVIPNPIEALIGLGNVQLKSKNYPKAVMAFKKALKLDKDSDTALSGLGTSLYRQGKVNEALPILENAIISENPSLDVIVALADIYEQRGDIQKAMRLNKLAISQLKGRFN